MIPRADVELSWDVDYEAVRTATEDELAWGIGTRQYSVTFVVDASWEEVEAMLMRERKVVARIGTQAANAVEFDQLAREEEGDPIFDDNEGFVPAPDLGVGAVSLALCAGGCFTAASCRGHPGEQAWSKWPLVLFHADAERARLIETLAREAGCGLVSSGERLELWSPSVAETMRLAELIMQARERFDVLPLPPALQRLR